MEEIIFSVTILTITYILTKHFLHKLQNLPPIPFPSLPVIGHLHLFKAPFHRTLASLAGRHGPVFLLNLGSRPLLVVSSPSAAEDCLSENDAVFANRPRLFNGELFGYNYTNILWAPYGDLWRSLRRIAATEVLSPHRLNLLHQIRADEIQALARRVRAAPDGVMDLKSAFFETVNNVMMKMITGKGFYGEAVESEQGKRFKMLFAKEHDGVTMLGDFFPVLRRLGLMKRKEMLFREKFKLIDGFFQEMVDQHREILSDPGQSFGSSTSSDHKSMIEVLIALQKEDPQFYTEEIVKGILLVMLLAGTDTSAGTLEWVMSLLLNHPSILKKAQEEIDSEVGYERLISESDLSRLPYLHCIINETLRMYPVAPLLIPHESSDECVVGGYKVPQGAMLMVNVWAIHNDPVMWDEPRKFKPERFEGVGGDRVGFKFIPFGTGRRACPGESLATRVVGFGLGMMLQCFNWERVGAELVDMEEGKGLTMPKAKPLFAKVHVREHIVRNLSNNTFKTPWINHARIIKNRVKTYLNLYGDRIFCGTTNERRWCMIFLNQVSKVS